MFNKPKVIHLIAKIAQKARKTKVFENITYLTVRYCKNYILYDFRYIYLSKIWYSNILVSSFRVIFQARDPISVVYIETWITLYGTWVTDPSDLIQLPECLLVRLPEKLGII